MSQPLINSIGVTILALMLGLLITAFWRSRDAAARHASDLAKENVALMSRVSQLEIQQAVQAQAIVPLSAGLTAAWVAKLTHMHTPELDQLLTLVGPPWRGTLDELARFEKLLIQRVTDVDSEVDEEEREIARLLPTLLRQVVRDFAALNQFPVQLIVAQIGPNLSAGGVAVVGKET